MYVIERQSAEGFFFHRKCFRCCVCKCQLLVGNYVYDDSENEEKDNFYCKLHYNQKIYQKPEKKAQNGLTGIVFWEALGDLVPFEQFLKSEKQPWRSVTFSKVASWLKVTLLYGCFSRFLNCANGTKLRKASHLTVTFIYPFTLRCPKKLGKLLRLMAKPLTVNMLEQCENFV